MLDLQKTNKIFSVEDQALELAEKLATITNAPYPAAHATHLIALLYEDYMPSYLKWHQPMGYDAENFMKLFVVNYPESLTKEIWQIFGALSDAVDVHLSKLLPYKTWGNLYLRVVGFTFIIEDCGDRRIDEWSVITANGTITPESVIKAIVETIEGRVGAESITGFDTEAIVKSVYQLAYLKGR